MKSRSLYLILLVPFLLSACRGTAAAAPEPTEELDQAAPTSTTVQPVPDRSSASEPRRNMGEGFTLGEGETAWIEGDVYQITVEEVLEDSRCPQGAECFWEGNAKVQVRVGEEVYVLTLGKLRPGDQDSVSIGDGLVLRVVSITPYPGSDQDGQPYQVTLIIEQETSRPYNYPANV